MRDGLRHSATPHSGLIVEPVITINALCLETFVHHRSLEVIHERLFESTGMRPCLAPHPSWQSSRRFRPAWAIGDPFSASDRCGEHDVSALGTPALAAIAEGIGRVAAGGWAWRERWPPWDMAPPGIENRSTAKPVRYRVSLSFKAAIFCFPGECFGVFCWTCSKEKRSE